jgi:hypothetical protein
LKAHDKWRLQGYDTFAREYYALAGEYANEAEAIAAAHRRLAEVEREQPSATSGGQNGIQDRVYVVRPDGSMFRVLPA